jgi:hypothetical protein
MAKSIIINLISIIPLGKEESIMQESLDLVIKQYLNISNSEVIIFTAIIKVINGKPKITVIKIANKTQSIFNINIIDEDLGNPDTVALVFKQIIQSITDQILNIILICWGHGMGYSMFGEITDEDNFKNLSTPQSIDFKDSFPPTRKKFTLSLALVPPVFINPFFKDFERMTGVSALTINELAEAINNSQLTFDLILLDNCFMQTVDTLYALKSKTRYLIAAQSGIPWQGFAYNHFNNLIKKIDDDFCIEFTSISYEKLKLFIANVGIKLPNAFSKEDLLISCLKTEKADDFFNSLIDIFSFLYKFYDEENPSLARSIYQTLTKSLDITQTSFELSQNGLALIDLKNYFANLHLSDPEFSNAYKKFSEIYISSILVSHQSSAILKDNTFGISICFPNSWTKCRYNPYYEFYLKKNAKVESLFSKKTKWGQFLFTYLTNINVP